MPELFVNSGTTESPQPAPGGRPTSGSLTAGDTSPGKSARECKNRGMVRVERDLEHHPVQPPAHGQGYPSLEQVAPAWP